MSTFVRFFHDESAATAIEYGLIAACISIAIIVAVQGVGSKLNSTFTQVQNALN
jgi:pilus assembly protein Flp/PilA